MKIVLLGYMASGKSTIGRLYAKKMGISFIDLDDYIEEKEQKSISEIFETKGEIYFRKQEHFYLKELLALDASFILALGGGTPCYAGNMDLLLADTNVKTVYMQTSINTIVERLKNERNKRPLVARLSEEELPEYIAKHLFERSYFYNKATMKLKIDDKKEETLLTELEEYVNPNKQ
ncbi:shikimate kinase [uncultured Tenacibaculum sp.]|uniref:shikimate kinase n=1 Tax=uncultured Tenacibaculum sp. TaxID=174713 RepID=UPI00261C9300|nr:shikimate kinase [uncultured Tenacibaculum sp.]